MRRCSIAAGLALVIAAVAVWRCRGRGDDDTAAHDTTATGSGTTAHTSRPRADPRTLERASIAGAVTDDAKAPIAHARVCADGESRELADELLHDPRCTETDDAGRYILKDLYAATYTIAAMAPTFRPGFHHPGGDRKRTALPLAAGAHATGIDVVLQGGGVEITGTVADLTGGPVARAQVRARADWWDERGAGAMVEADDAGKFALWVRPGPVAVDAVADGYAKGTRQGAAPGRFEILLAPESSFAGTVVDAKSNQPVEGARVIVHGTEGEIPGGISDLSDAQGKFRVRRLPPGRYIAMARATRGFGKTDGSTQVGLGQHVDGVVVRLFPGARVEGKVVIGADNKPCADASVSMRDADRGRMASPVVEPDGSVHADGVQPGTYQVDVTCRGYLARDRYAAVVVADQDVVGLEWVVDPGATIRGRVLGAAGAPIGDAHVWARSSSGAARAKTGWGDDRSTPAGDYELTGLRPGSYKVSVSSDKGVGPSDGIAVEVAAGATVQEDLALDDGGTIRGQVVDADGKPVPGIDVSARSTARTWGGSAKTDDDGGFVIDAVRAGDYRVLAGSWSDSLRKPGTTDDAKQGERATVKPGMVTIVRLVVESQAASIRGSVADADGKPVSDAFVSAVRESDAAGAQSSAVYETRWSSDDKPVLTGTDGAFVVGKLAPGKYTVRAFRKGGGEAVSEHVPAGTATRLQIKPTGSIAGTVKLAGGGAPEDLALAIGDPKTGFSRREQLYRTDGTYVLRDLPAGHFTIGADGDGGHNQIEVELGEAEAKTGVDLELAALVTVTGRVVDLVTKAPIPGMQMYAMPPGGRVTIYGGTDAELANITDDGGRFTIKSAPVGVVLFRGWPKERNGDYSWLNVTRTVSGGGTVDVGDLGLPKNRLKQGEPVGELGMHFEQQPAETPPDKQAFKVSWIDANGPAAKIGIKVGDVIASIDGLDVGGANHPYGFVLMRAAPGTSLRLGLARGDTVTLVLAPPS